MQLLTLRILTGADRGRIFRELRTPMTIGREEGNTIQLNDERVSRYHVKIQEDNGRLVVTDLESTNGTRVNGHSCNLKILRFGDTIAIGRSVLLVGTREQIAEEWSSENSSGSRSDCFRGEKADVESIGIEPYSTGVINVPSISTPRYDIALPRRLSTCQAAELQDLLDHIHNRMRVVLERGVAHEDSRKVSVDAKSWQSFLALQGEVSELIRKIENPSGNLSLDIDTGPE